MICEECKAQNLTSNVYPGVSTSTLMWCQPFYDEKGVYHDHDRNTSTTDYRCSNGHKWTKKSEPFKCRNCEWPNK